ncbi:MAG: prefoldin subunit alpha [Halobacteriota archaeon]|nr:prefoldin subunit alpha [Halobacteriota archaeon]
MEEREFQEMVLTLRQEQVKAEALTQQLTLIQSSVSEHDTAIEAIKHIKDLASGSELIVPIGAGTYVYATLSNIDKIIIELGSGVSAEKDPDGVVESLTKRRDELSETYKTMSEALVKTEENVQKLQNTVQSIVAQSQQGQMPPR